MIRKATQDDIIKVAGLYEKMFDYEEKTVKYTSWQRGIYPSADTARLGVKKGSLYVLERGSEILGAVILDNYQPPEYRNISWRSLADYGQALVIHTLCVDPEHLCEGIGSDMIGFAKEFARDNGCVCIRLNTTTSNIPAFNFYKRHGFAVVAEQKMLLNGQISCKSHTFMEFKIK